jgi:hypothetical protein
MSLFCSTLTVDGIISKWENQLRKDLEEYQRQSERVAMWDQQLRENQKMLNGLMDSVHRILADQEDLDGCIEAIEVLSRTSLPLPLPIPPLLLLPSDDLLLSDSHPKLVSLSLSLWQAYQRELDTELDSLSQDVDKYLDTVPLEPDEGTYAREQIYSLAIDLDQHLSAVCSS